MFKISDATKLVMKGKVRLWLEYALILAIVVLLGLATNNYIARLKLDNKVTTLENKVQTAQARVELVEGVNRQQAEALDTINSLTGVSDTMLKGLAADMEALRVRDRTTFNRLAALERSNEAVRKYLNTAVPAPVGCLLDKTCPDQDGGGGAGTAKPAHPAGSASRAGAQPH